jgi:glycosyltransferase involved in cell wall biosynthesis
VSENKDVILTGYVNDEELGNLYQNCKLFIFPSLFEGFGMPAVEAMSLGKPVITTRKGSLQEVTLNGAIYVENPQNPLDFEDKITQILTHYEAVSKNSEQMKNMIISQYTVAKIAQQYYDLFIA